MNNTDQLDDVLLQDILKAYQEAGGVNCFLKDEKLLEAVLLKLFSQPSPPPTVVIDLSAHAPWIKWGDRLQYKVQETPSLVQETQHALLNAPAGWKSPPPEQGLGHILRSEDLPES